jgi:Barstar (barnase inhibitor)
MTAGLYSAESLDAVRRRHPHVRVVGAARSKHDAIAAFYRAVDAPGYAAPNLDALADVLGDLGWLPEGPVVLAWLGSTALAEDIRSQLINVLRDAATSSAAGPRPLTAYLLAS